MYFVYSETGIDFIQDGPLRPEDTVAFLAVDFPNCIYFEADLAAQKDEGFFVLRHYQKDLSGLSIDGRRCEVCGGHMHDHEWADLDIHGFVVQCSFSVQKKGQS